MISDAKHYKSVLWLLRGRSLRVLLLFSLNLLNVVKFVNELILNQDKCLHRMLECELVFIHLRKDRTNVQVNVTWIANLQAVLNCFITVMQEVVFYLQCLFEIIQGRAKLLSPSEYASEVIISYSSEAIALLCQTLSLP